MITPEPESTVSETARQNASHPASHVATTGAASRRHRSLRCFTSGATLAVGLLTILPVRAPDPDERGLGRSAAWFPLVGAFLGAAAGGVRVLAQPLGALPATGLALATMIAVTGALHQDGLADTADGIGARGDRARRLAAMRDHAIGAFGVLALLWWGILMLTMLASFTDARALRVLIVAGAVSRMAAVLHAAHTGPARPDGLGAAFDVDAPTTAITVGVTAAVVIGTAGALNGGTALAVALLVAMVWTAWARRALGGRTGDTLGATIAVSEIATCAALLALSRG